MQDVPVNPIDEERSPVVMFSCMKISHFGNIYQYQIETEGAYFVYKQKRGDAFTNLIMPASGTLMGSLAVARIDWSTWVRFMWKYLGILVLCAAAAILLASLTGF